MLEARSLTKYYDHKAAVRQVSFTIRPGEILGYLGPNGAGKSTTVKMLVGLIEPSEGQIFYQGRSVYEDFAGFQQRIGYVPEEPHLYPHLSGREYLQLIGRLRAIPSRTLEPKLDEFLRLFGLSGQAHAPLTSYSKGMRQKVLLSAALLHDPEILILDEPFSGLDVTSALMLRSLLRTLATNGKIILYSSHVLEVVEKICSNVLILRRGEVVAHDSIENLRDLMKQPSLEAVFSQLADVDNGDELANNILDVMSRHAPPRAPRPSERPVEVGRRVYRGIAGAMPDEFQNVYGDEMMQTAEEAMGPVWRREGLLGLARMLTDAAVACQSSTWVNCAAMCATPCECCALRPASRWSRCSRSVSASPSPPAPTVRSTVSSATCRWSPIRASWWDWPHLCLTPPASASANSTTSSPVASPTSRRCRSASLSEAAASGRGATW